MLASLDSSVSLVIKSVASLLPKGVEVSWSCEKMQAPKQREIFSASKDGGDFSQTQAETPRTPKRKLKFSPNMEIGLEKKLECLTMEQWSSPTLRKKMTCGEEGMEVVSLDLEPTQTNNTAPTTSKNVGSNLRRVVLGKRRNMGGTGEVERATTALRAAALSPPKTLPVMPKGKRSGKRRGRKSKPKMPDGKQQKVDVMLKRSRNREENTTAELPSTGSENVTSGQVEEDDQPRVNDGVIKKC